MVREFSEEKRQEIFRLLDEIDNREWKSFMEWCGSSAEEFGVWPDKLAVSAYTKYVDEYHKKVLETNEMTRNRVNTVFENVADINTRYAGRMKECQAKIKEQIAMVNTMTEFMVSMTDGKPNMALLTNGSVNESIRTEEKVNLTVTLSNDAENETSIYFLNDYLYSREEFCPKEISGILDGAKDSGVITENEYIELENLFTELYILKADKDPDEIAIESKYDEIIKKYEQILERNQMLKYINEDVFRDVLGWNIDELDENFVEQLRGLMLEGGIVTDTSILFFLATIGTETGGNLTFLENRNNFSGKTYTSNTRGAGAMQITGGTQKEFIKYLINHTDDIEEINRLKAYYNGFYTYKYTIEVNGNDKEIEVWDNKYTYNGMTVAEYIAKYYPFESAVWFWSYNQASFEIDGQNLSINECIEHNIGKVSDITMFLAVTCAVNGSEFSAKGRGRFVNPDNDVDIVGDKIVLTVVDTTGEMAGNPKYDYNYLYTISSNEYGVYEFTSFIPNGWDRRSTLYDNLKDYFKED